MHQFLSKGKVLRIIYIIYSVLLSTYEDEKIKELVQICDYVGLKKYIILELQRICQLYGTQMPNQIEAKNECQLASALLKSLCCIYIYIYIISIYLSLDVNKLYEKSPSLKGNTRFLIIQVSEDDSNKYYQIVNAIFASQKMVYKTNHKIYM